MIQYGFFIYFEYFLILRTYFLVCIVSIVKYRLLYISLTSERIQKDFHFFFFENVLTTFMQIVSPKIILPTKIYAVSLMKMYIDRALLKHM